MLIQKAANVVHKNTDPSVFNFDEINEEIEEEKEWEDKHEEE